MKITGLSVFSTALPNKGGAIKRGTGITTTENIATIVRIETDEGLSGLGEICPIGTHYGRGWAEAVQAGIPKLAPLLIGQDPLHIGRINRQMDLAFKDDLFVKAPIDMALWDIAGKAAGRPVSDLLGGTWPDPVPLYRSVHVADDTAPAGPAMQERIRHYRAEGYRHFQLKTSRDPDSDIERIEAACDEARPGEKVIADFNASYALTDAVRVAQAVRDLPVILEQPCRTLEECIQFRRHCINRVKLDESMETVQDVIRGYDAGAMDIVCIKIGRVGGLSKARQMRDLCLELGLKVTCDDIWGSEIVSSALAHFAQSTDPRYCLNTTDLTDYVTVQTADGFTGRDGGDMTADATPGLGVTLREDAMGDPIFTL